MKDERVTPFPDFHLHLMDRRDADEASRLAWKMARETTGGRRAQWDGLLDRLGRLKAKRQAEAEALLEAYYETPEWQELVAKGRMENGQRVHLRKVHKVACEGDHTKLYSTWCGCNTKILLKPTKRIVEANPSYHHWLLKRVDCPSCLRILALDCAWNRYADLRDFRSSPKIAGPARKRPRGRPAKIARKRKYAIPEV